jgi:hypothetical protein
MVLGFRVICPLQACSGLVNGEHAKLFASLLHFIILLHLKTGSLVTAQVLDRLSLQ